MLQTSTLDLFNTICNFSIFLVILEKFGHTSACLNTPTQR